MKNAIFKIKGEMFIERDIVSNRRDKKDVELNEKKWSSIDKLSLQFCVCVLYMRVGI